MCEDEAALCKEGCLGDYIGCVEGCSGDVNCGLDCNREYVGCEQNCPTETTCDTSFLILNSYHSYETRLFSWQIGNEPIKETITEFTDFYGERATSDMSCSLIYKGQMYVIGGYDGLYQGSEQISVVDGCRLKRLDIDLPVRMDQPLCTSYNNGEYAMFCVTSVGYVDCWKFNGTNAVAVSGPESKHLDGAMTHWNDNPIIIGGDGYEVETYDNEKYDDGTNLKWNQEESVPSVHSLGCTKWSSVVNFNGDVYVFGGLTFTVDNRYGEKTAFKFDGSWKQIQNLAETRFSHRSVVRGDYIYHIGGNRDSQEPNQYVPFEEWKYDSANDNFTITLSNTTLYNFSLYLETFIVNAADYSECS